MKNIAVFILILTAVPAAAQKNFMVNINSGDFGVAGNIPFTDNYSRETTISLLNIGIEHRRTNIGMEFTPFSSFDWVKSSEEDNSKNYSFANFKFYWNVLNLELTNASIYFGPFVSINYLFVENSVNWNRYIFTGGVHLGLRGIFSGMYYKAVSFELGYRNIDGKSKYYIGVKLDLVLCIGSILYLAAASAASKNDN